MLDEVEVLKMKIQAEQVSVIIDGKTIISNVSFSANGGEIVAITGQSGCGKTTLLNCLGLIQPIDNGRILIDGDDVSHWSEKRR